MPDETKQTDGAPTDPAQTAAGGGGGGQPPVADAGANAPAETHGAGAQGEAEDAEGQHEDLDPRLAAVKPTFTRDDAFDRALAAAFDDVTAGDNEDALRALFDRIAKDGGMSGETAWRTLYAAGVQIPAWDERDERTVLQLTIFTAVVPALVAIADAQQARFDQLARDLLGEDRLAAMRKRRAGRRARRKERISKRPEAMAKMKEIRQRNEALNRGEAPPKPKAKPAPKKGRK